MTTGERNFQHYRGHSLEQTTSGYERNDYPPTSTSQPNFGTRPLLATSVGPVRRKWALLHPPRQQDGRQCFTADLDRVVSNKEERNPRMAVVRVAGRLTRAGVKKDGSLLNVPPPGKPHKYSEETAMDVQAVMESSAVLPRISGDAFPRAH